MPALAGDARKLAHTSIGTAGEIFAHSDGFGFLTETSGFRARMLIPIAAPSRWNRKRDLRDDELRLWPRLDRASRRAEPLGEHAELTIGGHERRRDRRLIAGGAIRGGLRRGRQQPPAERNGRSETRLGHSPGRPFTTRRRRAVRTRQTGESLRQRRWAGRSSELTVDDW